jgi:hypothetical protein
VVVGGSVPAVHDGWMWDLTVQDDHDFYVEPAAALPLSSAGPAAAVLVHNCNPEAKVWEPGRPETDNEHQGPLPPDAPMVEPDQALEEGHYHFVVMRGGALRAINSDDMWNLEPSAGHTSLAEGEPVIMAGGFEVDDTGATTEFDNNSGHYIPRDTSGYMPRWKKSREQHLRVTGYQHQARVHGILFPSGRAIVKVMG